MNAVTMRQPQLPRYPVNMDRQGNLLAWASVGPMALHILPVDALLWGPLRALCGTRPADARGRGSWRAAGLPISACTCRACWERYLKSLAASPILPQERKTCHA